MGMTESLLALTSANGELASVTAAMGQVDERVDATIIINAVGSIMMLNMGIALTAEMTAIGDLFTQVS